MATSSNGVDWERLPSAPSASPSSTAAQDQSKRDQKLTPQGKGCVMEPGQDWWTFDTCHMAVSDVQVRRIDEETVVIPRIYQKCSMLSTNRMYILYLP